MKASTDEFLRELKLIAHHIEERYRSKLESITSPFLLVIRLPDGTDARFVISKQGIKLYQEEQDIPQKIFITYRDFMRVLEKPSRALRYIFEGKIKVVGDYRMFMRIFENSL